MTAAVKGNDFLRFYDYPRATCGIGCGATTFSWCRVRILTIAAKNSSRYLFDGLETTLPGVSVLVPLLDRLYEQGDKLYGENLDQVIRGRMA